MNDKTHAFARERSIGKDAQERRLCRAVRQATLTSNLHRAVRAS